MDDEELLQTLHENAAKDTHVKQLKALQLRLDHLQHQLTSQASEMSWSRDKGELPPRDPTMCRELDDITDEFTTTIERLMRDMKLVSKSTIRQSVLWRRKKILAKLPIPERDKNHSTPRMLMRYHAILKNDRKMIRHGIRTRRDHKIRAATDTALDDATTAIGIATTLFSEQDLRHENETAIETHRPTDRYDRRHERTKRYASLTQSDRQALHAICGDDLRRSTHIAEILGETEEEEIPANESTEALYSRRANKTEEKASEFRRKYSPRELGIPDIPGTLAQAKVTSKLLESLAKAMMSIARHDRQDRLLHGAKTTRTGNIARILRPKTYMMPEGHPFTLDPVTKQTRRCRTNQEILQATRDVHTKWTGPSNAIQQFFFGTLEDDAIGPNRLSNPPDRAFNADDIARLLPNYTKYPQRVTDRFVEAHQSLRTLFEERQECQPEFLWPFYVDIKTGTIEADGLEDEFWKGVLKCPTKARHEEFHLAIFGRLHKPWGKVMYKIIEMSLVTRYIPRRFKPGSRIPTPKPTPGETRPLTILQDCFCFESSAVGGRLQEALDKTGVVPDEAVAFRKGKGCDDITHLIIGLKHDAVESSQPIAFVFEDEEKFYDRVIAELQACGLLRLGLPARGYVEFKIEEMHERYVDVRTRQGNVRIPFRVGLFQGSMLSVVIANVITAFKFQAWKRLGQPGYKPATMDDRDEVVATDKPFWAKGYCDDNTLFFGIPDESEELSADLDCLVDTAQERQLPRDTQLRRAKLRWTIRHAERSIRTTGDLSLITKLGRKGSKSEVHILNIHPDDRDIIPETLESIAWSYKLDGIEIEKVPVKAHFQERGIEIIGSPDKLAPCEADESTDNDSDKHDSRPSASGQTGMASCSQTSTESTKTATDAEYFESDRQLGIYSTVDGQAEASTKRLLQKTTTRMQELKVWKVRGKALPIAINTLLDTVLSYGPLLQGLTTQMLVTLDKRVTDQIHTICGLSKSDNKAMLHIQQKHQGVGIKSLTGIHVIDTARESEVLLNDKEQHAQVARGRYKSATMPGQAADHMGNNFVAEALAKLGYFGIWIRDARLYTFERWLNRIALQQGAYPIGHPDIKDRTTHQIGIRKSGKMAAEFASGGHGYMLLRNHCESWIANNAERHWSALAEEATWYEGQRNKGQRVKGMPKSLTKQILATTLQQTLEETNSDLSALYDVWEWSRPLEDWRDPWTDEEGWKQHKIAPVQWQACEFHEQDTFIYNHARAFVEGIRLDPNSDQFTDTILEQCGYPHEPLLAATDGGHEGGRTTSAVALFAANAEIGWGDKQPKPLLIRIAMLPKAMGDAPTDNDHGEEMALVLLGELLPKDAVVLAATDSTAGRSKYIRLRDHEYPSHRRMLRQIYSGISKCITARLHREIATYTEPHQAQTEACKRLKAMLEDLRKLVSDSKEKPWPVQYWDSHPTKALIKVDSHQLNQDGSKAKRYAEITPNACIVYMNQVADNAASFAMGTLRGIPTASWTNEHPDAVKAPPSNRFEIMIGELACDKDTSRSIWNRIDQDMIRRAQFKAKQGAALRAAEYCQHSRKLIPNQGSTKRLFHGIANAHTRSCYKDEQYALRTWHHFHDADELMPGSAQKIELRSSHICPLCVTSAMFQARLTDRSRTDTFPRGTSEHLHLHCTAPTIREKRTRLLILLETACRQYIRMLKRKIGIRDTERRLIELVEANRELEIRSSREMHAKCESKQGNPRIHNAVYTTRRHDLQGLLEDVDNEPDNDAQTNPDGDAHTPWTTTLGLTPNTKVPETTALGATSALDFTHLGLYPDQILQWHEQNAIRTKMKELRAAWQRIEALLLARPEIMQQMIKARLDAFEKQLLDRYPHTEKEEAKVAKFQATRRIRRPRAHPYVIDIDVDEEHQPGPPDTDQTPATTTAGATQPRERQRKHRCQGLVCRTERAQGKDTNRLVVSANANCETCRVFHNATRRAELIEDILLDDSRERNDLAAKMAETHKGECMDTLRTWACRKADDDRLWPKIPQKDISNNTSQTKYQTRALRMIAKTLTIPLPGRVMDIDPTPDEKALKQDRADCATCRCRRRQPSQDGEDDEIPDELCYQCGYLKRLKAPPPGKCICCGKRKLRDDIQQRPCTICRWVWRLWHRSTYTRLMDIQEANDQLEMMAPDEEATERTDQASQTSRTSDSRTSLSLLNEDSPATRGRRMQSRRESISAAQREQDSDPDGSQASNCDRTLSSLSSMGSSKRKRSRKRRPKGGDKLRNKRNKHK